jgi:hypothetical protein
MQTRKKPKRGYQVIAGFVVACITVHWYSSMYHLAILFVKFFIIFWSQLRAAG